MALDKAALAAEINDAIAATDGNGSPIPVTPEMEAYAEAVVTTLQAGLVNHAIPGLVTGTTAPGAPLAAGAASNGLVSVLVPATWSAAMLAAIPAPQAAPNLTVEATASTAYLMASCLVGFSSGSITGTCTSTPTSPGPLAAGQGMGGSISGLDGASWANAVMPPNGDSSLSQAIYKAIVKHIQDNAQVQYAVGTVNGTCPPGGGPLALGLAAGGTIT